MRAIETACLAFLAIALLTGCSSDGESPQPGETAAAVPDDWEVTPAQVERLYNAKLANLEQAYSLDHPVDAQLVRYVTATEIAQVISSCAGEAGFSVQPNDQGGVSIDPAPAGQESALNEALARCEAMYPLDPRFNMQLPRLRAEAQYRFLTETVAACVQEQGYSLSDPPSLQVWLDDYYSTGSAWDPFALAAEQMLPDDGAEPLNELYRNCPTISDEVYPPMDLG
jgi:hypothetical protein